MILNRVRCTRPVVMHSVHVTDASVAVCLLADASVAVCSLTDASVNVSY